MADSADLLVLDTNVLVSAFLNPFGPPAQVLRLVLAGKLRVAHDSRILAEYSQVLRRPVFDLAPAEVDAVLGVLEKDGLSFVATPLSARLPDVTDEPFLEVARAASACLVTGNLRHFPDRARGGTQVVSPKEFLAHLS